MNAMRLGIRRSATVVKCHQMCDEEIIVLFDRAFHLVVGDDNKIILKHLHFVFHQANATVEH